MSLAPVPVNHYAGTLDTTSDNQWIGLIQPAAELANTIARTEFVPEPLRNNPGAITACILYGAEIGIGPMMSLAKIDMVKGRPAPKAELARALALAAGHEVWVDEQTNTKCKVSGRRRGSQQVQTVTWTLDDVKKAGISNQNYSRYPRQMLLARASAELVRMMCPDVLGGIALFAEEVGDVDEPVLAAAPAEPSRQTRKRTPAPAPSSAAQPHAAPDPVDVDEQPPLPDELPRMITGDQMKKMMAQFGELGLRDREDRLAFVAAAVRPVETSKDLTVDEASTVIDTLGEAIAGTIALVWTGAGAIELTKGR